MRDIAFYAPMKSPTHAKPSGDREMARNLMAAIGAHRAAGQVDLVSELQSHDPAGSPETQAGMQAQARAEIARLTETLAGRDIGLWVTYHNYYKAPDLLGPAVCAALNLPYVIIEASRAKRRLTGPWAEYAAAAETACDAAQVIFYMTEHDLLTLERDRTPDQALVHLRPFLPLDDLPAPADPATGTMLSVGMMRKRDKLESYRIIAGMLACLTTPDWRLDIVGDGPARAEVEDLMRPFGDRVRFMGQLDRAALSQAYAAASLFLWPGANEAYGMVYLEAQAAGLPIVAQDRIGVREVLAVAAPTAPYPDPELGAAALAASADALLQDPDLRRAQGRRAREMISQRHLKGNAMQSFWQAVTPLMHEPAQ